MMTAIHLLRKRLSDFCTTGLPALPIPSRSPCVQHVVLMLPSRNTCPTNPYSGPGRCNAFHGEVCAGQ